MCVFRRNKSRLIREFIEWYYAPDGDAINLPNGRDKLSAYFKQTRAIGQLQKTLNDFIISINDELNNAGNKSVASITIDKNIDSDGKHAIQTENEEPKTNIHNLNISNTNVNSGRLLIKGLTIANLSISQISQRGVLIIEDCKIKSITISNNSSVIFKDTYIGTLKLPCPGTNVAVNHLSIKGGCILDIECPLPEKINPFNGSVTITDIFLPKTTKGYPLKDSQPFKNIAHHLRKMEATQTASIFHSAELALDRENDTLPNKFVSHLYQTVSDCGASWFRPLIWWLIVLLVSASYIWWTDGAVLTSNQEAYIGFRASLVDCTSVKAFYLSAQSMANPLSLFSSKALVVAKSGGLAIWLAIQSIASIVLITLMISAIRRRFKIQQ